MTRIIYLAVSLLMLAMGVVTYDHWGNMVNIPEDRSEEIRETSFFPIRRIRPSNSCRCESIRSEYKFGRESHPRVLVTNPCANRTCVTDNICQDIPYTVNVSKFEDIEIFADENSPLQRKKTCYRVWRSEALQISAACVPVYATMIG